MHFYENIVISEKMTKNTLGLDRKSSNILPKEDPICIPDN
jgi:hypothetical protein